MLKPTLMGKFRAFLKKRLMNRDERGQSTTEYILILAAVVMVASKFGPQLKGIVDKVVKKADTQIDNATIE